MTKDSKIRALSQEIFVPLSSLSHHAPLQAQIAIAIRAFRSPQRPAARQRRSPRLSFPSALTGACPFTFAKKCPFTFTKFPSSVNSRAPARHITPLRTETGSLSVTLYTPPPSPRTSPLAARTGLPAPAPWPRRGRRVRSVRSRAAFPSRRIPW